MSVLRSTKNLSNIADATGGGASAEEIERLDAVNNSQNTLISELIAVNGSQDAGIASLNTRFVSVASVNSIQNTAISAIDSIATVTSNELVATNARVAGVKAYTDELQGKITTTASTLVLNADTINIATHPEVYQEVNISGFGDTVNINPSVLNLATVGSAVINIGTGSAPNVINLGGVDDTVNIAGKLVIFETTNTAIKDKIVSLNRGGDVGTGFNTGFEVEEDGVATGYIKTNGDASQWLVKAPVGSEYSLKPEVSPIPNTFVGRDANGYTAVNGLVAPVVQTAESSGSSINLFANAPEGAVFMALDAEGLSFDNQRSGGVNDLNFFNGGDSLKLRQETRVGNGDKFNETLNTIPELQIRQGAVRMGVIGEAVSSFSAKQLVLNSEGASKTAQDAGIVVRQDGVDDGYIKLNGDRDKWLMKAPAGAEFELAGSVVGNVSATANTLVQRDAGGEGRFTSVIAEGSNGIITRKISNISGPGVVPLEIVGYDTFGTTIAKLISTSSSEGGMFLQRIDGPNLIKCCDLKLYGGSSGNTTDAQAIFRAEARGVPNKFSNTNVTEAQVFTNDVRRAYFGATFSGVESPYFTAPNLIATTTLAANGIDMTPTTATVLGNWFRVRTTPNFTISFRRYGDLVFWSIPPIMDVVTPINTIYNATTTFDYFEFTGLIPVGFRPLASSNRSLIAVTVWNGNAVTNAFNLAYVNMISNGLIVVNLPNGQTFQNGRLAGWHTQLQGSYRIV